jgi:hypothetical protein
LLPVCPDKNAEPGTHPAYRKTVWNSSMKHILSSVTILFGIMFGNDSAQFSITGTPAFAMEDNHQNKAGLNHAVTDTTKPVIVVQSTHKQIVIDGQLNDDAWQDASAYEGHFFQSEPGDRTPSSEKTKVMVLQDEKTIYFGIQCYDSDAAKIFASAMRRDTDIWRDDVVELLLDTFRDNRNCYAFVTNSLGVQGDAIISDQGNHINLEWDCVLFMDGAMNGKGWSAEFAIPFKSLKYKDGETVEWGLNITRDIKHRNEKTFLVPIARGLGHNGKFYGELFASLTNIHPPKQRFNFELHPYLLAGQTSVFQGSSRTEQEIRSGVDFRYDVTPQLALDLTYKTDFAQAESEEELVNVTRFNIRREEKRQFFLQSAGLFQFGPGQQYQNNFSLFDSRTIGIKDGQRVPLLGGVKLTGRADKYSIALLNLQAEQAALEEDVHEPTTNFTALRLKRDIFKSSHIGFMSLNKQSSDSLMSRAFGIDGLFNFNEVVRVDASLANSISPSIHSSNWAGDAGFILNKEWIDMSLRYTHIDTLFRPEMGFLKRGNIRNTDADLTFTKWLNNATLQNISLATDLLYASDHHNVLQQRDNGYTLAFTMRQGDKVSVKTNRSYEFVPSRDYIRTIMINEGIYKTWSHSILLNSYRARPINISSEFAWGRLYDGTNRIWTLTGTAKFSKHLLVDLNYAYNDLNLKNGQLKAHVLSTRWTYCFSPSLFAKSYLQWNSADERVSANFLIDYTFRPLSHIYLVYTENKDTFHHRTKDRLLLMKFSYLWQS